MQISINNFHKGQSTTPYTTDGAFSKSQNLDVFSQPGIARINYLPTGFSTNLTGLPINFATNSNQSYYLYFADDAEDVYSYNTSTNAIGKIGDNKGNNVEYYNGALYAIRRNVLNKYDFSTWADTGETLTALGTKDNHFMFVSRNDGNMYVAGSYSSGWGIAKLTKASAWTQMAFTMPTEYKPISITELGLYLIISAKKVRATTEINIPETTYFFWDRSSSTTDKIITVPEIGMHTFIKQGEIIYITGGEQGNIYRLTESGFSSYAQIPFDYDNKKVKIGNISDTVGTNSFQSGTWFRNKLVVGVTSEDTLSPAGIYGIKDGAVAHEFNPSNGDDASTNDIIIGGMTVFTNGKLYYGWKKVAATTTYGLDEVSIGNNRVPSYDSYYESIFTRVGTTRKPVYFEDIDIELARPLQTGEAIRVRYRETNSGDWTTIKDADDFEMTFTHLDAVAHWKLPFRKNDVRNIQFRIELTTGSGSTNTPYLLDFTAPYYYG